MKVQYLDEEKIERVRCLKFPFSRTKLKLENQAQRRKDVRGKNTQKMSIKISSEGKERKYFHE